MCVITVCAARGPVKPVPFLCAALTLLTFARAALPWNIVTRACVHLFVFTQYYKYTSNRKQQTHVRRHVLKPAPPRDTRKRSAGEFRPRTTNHGRVSEATAKCHDVTRRLPPGRLRRITFFGNPIAFIKMSSL